MLTDAGLINYGKVTYTLSKKVLRKKEYEISNVKSREDNAIRL